MPTTMRRRIWGGVGAIGALAIAATVLLAGPASAMDVIPAENTVQEMSVPDATSWTRFIGTTTGPDREQWFIGADGLIAGRTTWGGIQSWRIGNANPEGSPDTLVGWAQYLDRLYVADQADDTVRQLSVIGASTTFPIDATPTAGIQVDEQGGVWVPTDAGFVDHLGEDGSTTRTDIPNGVGVSVLTATDGEGRLQFVVPGRADVYTITHGGQLTDTPLPGSAGATAIAPLDDNGVVLVGRSDGSISTVDTATGTVESTQQNADAGASIDSIVAPHVNGGSVPWFLETIGGDTSAVGYVSGGTTHVLESHPAAQQRATVITPSEVGMIVSWAGTGPGGRSGLEYFEFDGTLKFLPLPTRNGAASAATAVDGFTAAEFGTGDGRVGTAGEITTSRLSGGDRWQTDAAVAERSYPDGALTVVIASGTSFPDALAAAPAAAKIDAPVLLVTHDTIPSQVAGEIEDLRATRAVIIGGEAAVGPAVEQQLEGIVGASHVRRIGGADRVQTSELVAQWAFGASGAANAMVVTGWSAPDALAAGAAIGTSGPVLLVNGATGVARSDTAATLSGLGVRDVYVAGGVNAVPDSLVTPLATVATVHRDAGADRYATAAALAEQFHPSATTAVIATGTTFPDALAGSAMAAHEGAPLLLSTPSCLPTTSQEEMALEGVQTVTLLGGFSALQQPLDYLHSCAAVSFTPPW